MKTSTFLSSVAQAAIVASSPLSARQSCPGVHVFGARETTVSAGFGSAGTVVDLITAKYSGATSEAINYPACGGQASCGSISYGDSVNNGTNAVTEAVNSYVESCPDTQIVLVGYSQGGQIMDNALCGGGDSSAGITDTSVPLSSAAVAAVKAAIFMGNPRFVAGPSYDIGTCESGGFDARPASFTCPSGAKVQSYCDSADPYCCDGSDAATHQGYGTEYGQDALTFVEGKITS